MSHTPAPWITEGYTGNIWGDINNPKYDGDSPLVACIYSNDRKGYTTNEEEEANAQLIAAAPDLLKSLKALMSDIEAVNKTNGQQVGHGRYLDAIKAIKKAEGK